MAVGDENFQRITKFLNSISPIHRCPVCGTSAWDVLGLSGIMMEPGPQDLKGVPPGVKVTRQEVPVVVMACKRCKHIRQFAWEPIKRETGGG